MKRWNHFPVMEVMQQRLDNNPEIPILGKQTEEHSFGTLECGWVRNTS